MTTEAKQTISENLGPAETQVEASVPESPQHVTLEPNNKNSPSQAGDIIELKESDLHAPFARDINHKLDELEVDISKLTNKFKSSQGDLAHAMGDLKSRTALMTDDITRVAKELETSDTQQHALIESLEGRLRDATYLLTEQLNKVDSQLESHHSSISGLRDDLSDAYQKLEARLTGLQQDTQDKLHDLYAQQEQNLRTQQAFSDYMDELQLKANSTADSLYALETNVAEEKRFVQHQFKVVSAVGISLLFILAAFMAYFQTTDTADTRKLSDMLAATTSNINENFAPQSAVTALDKRLAEQIDLVEQSVERTKSNTLRQQSLTSESLKDIAAKVEALQLSLYGPTDTALPAPSIAIQNTSWVKAQNPAHYAIQLVGVYRESAMIDFANRNASALSDHPISFTISEYRGQNWYNLLLGNFASFSEALGVLNDLPAGIQKNSPWVRQMASIQNTAK